MVGRGEYTIESCEGFLFRLVDWHVEYFRYAHRIQDFTYVGGSSAKADAITIRIGSEIVHEQCGNIPRKQLGMREIYDNAPEIGIAVANLPAKKAGLVTEKNLPTPGDHKDVSDDLNFS